MKPSFSVVLIGPEIPGNTGSIGRTCVALGIPLILIGPYGFDISEKAVRRAGLDYWKHLELKEYQSWESFLDNEKPKNLFLFENHKEQSVFDASFERDSYLVFGSETKGIPQEILKANEAKIFSLPMYSDKIRSLNLANAVTAVCYQCLRSQN